MTNSSGLATFNNVTVGTAGIGLTLNANSTGLSQGTSSSFNVTVLVQTGATLTDAAADAGSGVKSVAYYYCSGYTTSCTSSSGAFIGSSSNSGNSYQVTWSSEPANGAYDVVAVGTDNVNQHQRPEHLDSGDREQHRSDGYGHLPGQRHHLRRELVEHDHRSPPPRMTDRGHPSRVPRLRSRTPRAPSTGTGPRRPGRRALSTMLPAAGHHGLTPLLPQTSLLATPTQ